MIRTMRRAWRYFAALLSGKLDDLMDPRIQIEQALDEAKRQHGLLSEQAGAVLGNERELETRIARAQEEAARLRDAAGRTLVLADRARRDGDEMRAAAHERTARAFAGRLASLESSTKVLRGLLEKARLSSAAARRAVEQNAGALQRQLTERAELLTELEAAKMQERMADTLKQIGAFAAPGDVPTLANVRDRIDARFARATGRGEIAADTADARLLEAEQAQIELEGEQRLDEIRRSLGLAAATDEETTRTS
jgi:phage shock protein A